MNYTSGSLGRIEKEIDRKSFDDESFMAFQKKKSEREKADVELNKDRFRGASR